MPFISSVLTFQSPRSSELNGISSKTSLSQYYRFEFSTLSAPFRYTGGVLFRNLSVVGPCLISSTSKKATPHFSSRTDCYLSPDQSYSFPDPVKTLLSFSSLSTCLVACLQASNSPSCLLSIFSANEHGHHSIVQNPYFKSPYLPTHHPVPPRF